MVGNENDSLTSKQIKFIDAMLTEPTIEKACQKVGVSRATGHKYLKVAAVKKTLRIKQDEMMDKTTQMLYLASSNAVSVLNDIMMDTKVNPFIRTQAAKAIAASKSFFSINSLTWLNNSTGFILNAPLIIFF